jgi:CsoR family transcriptional regulator, copper-sensing transcriptional repressor
MIADIQKRSLHRTKIIQGQLRALETAIENEQYCMDILTQNLAIQKSLGSLSKLILENHLRTHVAQEFAHGDVEASITELLQLYELRNNRGK